MRHLATYFYLLLFPLAWNTAFIYIDQHKRIQKPSSNLALFAVRSQFDLFFPEFASRLNSLSINGAFEAICFRDAPPKHLIFKDLHLYTENIPSINRFLLANPKVFLMNEDLAKAYGVSFERLFAIFAKYKDENSKFKYYLENPSEIVHDLSVLAYILPVVYVTEFSPAMGVLGLQLNAKSVRMPDSKDLRYQNNIDKVKDLFPYYKGVRDQDLYQGGFEKKGAKLLMIHQQKDFPMNRKFRTLPGKPEFELYYSPEVAMANDMVMTNDAKASDFRFFQYGTQWSPAQLDLQCSDNLWFVFDGPPSLVFTEDSSSDYPLYSRIANSFKLKDFETTLIYSNSPEVQKERQMILKANRQSGRLQAASIQDQGLRQRQEDSDRLDSIASKLPPNKKSNPFTENLFKPKIPTTPQPSFGSSSSPSRKALDGDILDFDRKIRELTENFQGGGDDFDDEFFELSKKRLEGKQGGKEGHKAGNKDKNTPRTVDEKFKRNTSENDDDEVDEDMLDDFFRF